MQHISSEVKQSSNSSLSWAWPSSAPACCMKFSPVNQNICIPPFPPACIITINHNNDAACYARLYKYFSLLHIRQSSLVCFKKTSFPKGRRHNKKTRKCGTFLNLRLIWKILTPPIGSIWDIFEFENILMAEEPPGLTSQKGYLGIFTLKRGKLSVFLFFLGWGLRVTYNSDFFEKFGFSNVRIWIWDIFVFFLTPPPPFGTLSQIFLFLNYDASPKESGVYLGESNCSSKGNLAI